MDIVIVHFNTPKLTECLVKSINKHMKDVCIYIFDNSNKSPFTAKFNNVTIIDNTNGQIIDFDKWLEKFPYRENTAAKKNSYGSAKHCYTIEKCMELIGKNFLLLDSDVLVKQDLSNFIDDSKVFVGSIEKWKAKAAKEDAKYRAIPYLLYINVDNCREHGIHFFNERYMYGLSEEGNLYDTGTYFYEQVEKHGLPWKREDFHKYVVHYKAGSWINEAKKYDGYRPLDADKWLNKFKALWEINGGNVKPKKAIYTCITNGYDTLDEHPFICEGFDYICFTDNQSLKSNVWQIRQMPKETQNIPSHKKQRFVKINPHIVLPEYDLSVWVDGNIHIQGDVNELLSNESIIIPQHPERECIYDEMEACYRIGKDTMDNMLPQITRYKNENFPSKYGMVQSNIIIRKHNTEECKRLMNLWWKELSNGSHRDQLSFNYCLWKNQDIKVKLLDKHIYKSKWFIITTHHKSPHKPKSINDFTILNKENKNKQRKIYSYNPLIQENNSKKVKVKRRVFF